MTRPAVSVVMPFAGTVAAAHEALSSLLGIEMREGDELIVADNSATVPATPGVTVVAARAERSPAHARNAGAERAGNEWILFLDADCRPRQGLLDAYFVAPVEPKVGALAGGVVAAPGGATLAARYGAARNFLSQEAHLAHPFRPRAVAANLMVRRSAFEQVGGFHEGLRAAEDTDFSWRLQESGWALVGRPEARVEHHYRATLAELRRQWRGYAAGRAWLGRRYEGFTPEAALVRAWRAGGGGVGVGGGGGVGVGVGGGVGGAPRSYLALDALLALDELAGFALSNRPPRDPPVASARLVLVADRFPPPEFTSTPAGARVEAARRPDVIDHVAARSIYVDYCEDEGMAARLSALALLVGRHPVRSARDVLARRRERPSRGEKAPVWFAFSPRRHWERSRLRSTPGQPSLPALAPAALRLARDPGVRVQAVGSREAEATARRLAALAGARYEPGGH